MDMLKRSLAPITDEAWAEIQEQAKKTLTSTLTARKFVDVVGPKGWDYTVVPTGRLTVATSQPKDGVKYGIYQAQPLIETRIPFELDIWELDNIARGARDLDLQPVIDAARKAALFEEQAIYHGFKDGAIAGILACLDRAKTRLGRLLFGMRYGYHVSRRKHEEHRRPQSERLRRAHTEAFHMLRRAARGRRRCGHAAKDGRAQYLRHIEV